ncbi:MAG TPA: hypothetical protein VME92_10860 [Acetobacteraceae bacterium]|nr:hypothetical protein [Acetobacteraceae bacterium]
MESLANSQGTDPDGTAASATGSGTATASTVSGTATPDSTAAAEATTAAADQQFAATLMQSLQV